MCVEKAIITNHKRMIILNVSPILCLFLIEICAYCYNHSGTAVLDAKYRVYCRNNSLISSKTSEIFVEAVKIVVCWRYKMRSSSPPDVPHGQLRPFRLMGWTNFAVWHIIHNWSVIDCVRLFVRMSHVISLSRCIKMWEQKLALL
jgi:hypothetical protein